MGGSKNKNPKLVRTWDEIDNIFFRLLLHPFLIFGTDRS